MCTKPLSAEMRGAAYYGGLHRYGLPVTLPAMPEKRRVGPSVRAIPEGDNRPRLICPDCGHIEYANPKIVVGAVCTWRDSVLLCRRDIPPARGLWTLPAGFMELGETTCEGAAREVREEAEATVRIGALLGIYEIPSISQVHMFFRAVMVGPHCGPGEESQEAGLFSWKDIPWNELAFPSVRWALKKFPIEGGPWFETAAPQTVR